MEFQVEFPEDGLEFTVPADVSLVDAALDHGLQILTGCTDGKCGTCLVRVLSGEVDHRDRVLTPEKREEGWMCACVSRGHGKLVLEQY